MSKESFSERVLRGDTTTINEARVAYRDNPSDENFFTLVMVLYSFRHRADCAELLVKFSDRLDALAEAWNKPIGSPEEVQCALDRADRLSTYLLWLSRQDSLSDKARSTALVLAYEVADLAQAVPGVAPHTQQLLQLTAIEAVLEQRDWTSAEVLLADMRKPGAKVKNPDQRARIMRKYGSLRRRIQWWRGTVTIIRSALVLDIAPMTRRKSLAALFGHRG